MDIIRETIHFGSYGLMPSQILHALYSYMAHQGLLANTPNGAGVPPPNILIVNIQNLV